MPQGRYGMVTLGMGAAGFLKICPVFLRNFT
jgi:hypothetical protein